MKTGMWIAAIALATFVAFTAGASTGYFGALGALGEGDRGAESYDVQPDATATLSMRSSRFSPSTLDVTAGALTEIAITNEDQTLHTFTYEKAGSTYDHILQPGESTRILVRFAETGTIEFRCKPHDGMRGTLHVEA